MRVLKVLLAFVAAVLVGFVTASVLHSQFVLAKLAGVGAEIPAGAWLRMTATDVVGFFPLFPAVVAAGLAIGFVVAAVLKRVLKPLAPVAYPLAGAAAIGTALFLMGLQFEMTPVAGARGALGFAAQCGAGALAGWVFALLLRRRAQT